MESLSDNWRQWMEMIWSVLKQMRFALRGFAVTIPIWFGLDFPLRACTLSIFSTNGRHSDHSVKQHGSLWMVTI